MYRYFNKEEKYISLDFVKQLEKLKQYQMLVLVNFEFYEDNLILPFEHIFQKETSRS